jgi:hypothetical protein
VFWWKGIVGGPELVQMISTIYGITIVKTRRKDRKTNLEKKKLYTVIQYNKYINLWIRQTITSVLRNYCKVVEK